MRVVLMGPPGSGKGVQGELIKKRFGIPRISTGDMFREAIQNGTNDGKEAKKYMDAGMLVPDEVVMKIIGARLSQSDCKDGFVLDGFPRTVVQGEGLDGILRQMNSKLDFVLSLEVPSDVIIGRLASRRVCSSCGAVFNMKTAPPPADNVCTACGGSIIQRDDDREDTIRKRLEVYERQTAPLKVFYRQKGELVEINGAGNVDTIQKNIEKALE